MTRALALIVLAACGDDAAGVADAPDISTLAYTTCDPASRVGGFEVALADDYTAVQGQVFDATLPSAVPTTLTTVAECALVSSPNYTCSPACTASQVCTAQQTCMDYPVAHSVGNVEVAGLAAAVQMTPRSPTFFYSNTADLPHPGFTAGAAIGLSAAGGDYTAFALRGYGVTPLALTTTEFTVERDQPLALTWTPADGPTQITISLNINGHGLVGAHVECTVDDSGSYTLPAALITQLVEAGTSGFPTITLSRTSSDTADIAPGCVDLRVHSTVKRDVTLPGVQSCNDDAECTAPQTCQGDLTCG